MRNEIFNTSELKELKVKAENGNAQACIALVDIMLQDRSVVLAEYRPDTGDSHYDNYLANQAQEYHTYDNFEDRQPSNDHFEAAFYFSKIAAELGDPLGMYRLAWRYENGEGCTKSLDNALSWWKKGMEKGDENCRKEYELRRPKGFFESLKDIFS